MTVMATTATVPGPRDAITTCPPWCDPKQCLRDTSGDVIHNAKAAWRTAEGGGVQLTLAQVHCVEDTEPQTPVIYLDVWVDPREDNTGLSPSDARAIGAWLLAYGTKAGGDRDEHHDRDRRDGAHPKGT